jgi:TetR/AcrR family transcriptional regulator
MPCTARFGAVSKPDTKETARNRRDERRLAQQRLAKDQLLDAAEEVFGQKGFYEATMREVAELADFAVGSVYTFFENKDDLLEKIFLRRADQLSPQLHQVLDDSDRDPVEQLHELVDLHVEFFRRHRNFGVLYLRYSNALFLAEDRQIDRAIRGRYDHAMDQQAQLIARGQASGVFRHGDSYVLSRVLTGMIVAFLATDAAVVRGEPVGDADPAPREFHDIVGGAFLAS